MSPADMAASAAWYRMELSGDPADVEACRRANIVALAALRAEQARDAAKVRRRPARPR